MKNLEKGRIRPTFSGFGNENPFQASGRFESVGEMILRAKIEGVSLDMTAPVAYDEDDNINPVGDWHLDKFDIVNLAFEQGVKDVKLTPSLSNVVESGDNKKIEN